MVPADSAVLLLVEAPLISGRRLVVFFGRSRVVGLRPGTKRDHALTGAGGPQTIYGDNMTYAGGGPDLCYGGNGDDRIFGQRGPDERYGGNRGDQLVCGGPGVVPAQPLDAGNCTCG